MAARTTASLGVGVACTNRFMPKGVSVSARTCAAASAMAAGERMPQPSMPKPPACDTAAASAGLSAPAMGACTMGSAIFKRWSSVGVIGKPLIFGFDLGSERGDKRATSASPWWLDN